MTKPVLNAIICNILICIKNFLPHNSDYVPRSLLHNSDYVPRSLLHNSDYVAVVFFGENKTTALNYSAAERGGNINENDRISDG